MVPVLLTSLCRLSEPNMAFISGQLEELYMAHSRKDMSDTLTATLMDACVTSSTMPSRLMMEHVLLVSILHHTVGIEVLAHRTVCHLPAVAGVGAGTAHHLCSQFLRHSLFLVGKEMLLLNFWSSPALVASFSPCCRFSCGSSLHHIFLT